MGDGREGVERVAALGRDRGVGDRRAVEVDRHVVGEVALDEDVAQEPLVAGTRQDGVVADVGPFSGGAGRAEIPDEKPHRPAARIDLRVGPALAREVAQKPGVGVAGIGVRDDDVRRQGLARCEADARGAALLDEDLVGLGFEANAPPLPFHDVRHGVGDGRDPADGVMHSEFLLEMRHEGVHRRDVHRVAADEERVERQRHAEALVLHPGAGEPENRPVGAQAGELGEDLRGAPEPVHRLCDHALEADDVAAIRILEKPQIAVDIPRREAADLLDHRVGRAARGEMRAVGPADLVERVERTQVDIGVEVAPARGPELAEDLGDGDDRRPEVEPVTAGVNRGASAAGRVEPVEDRDGVALGAEAHGGGETAEAGADDDGG